MYTFLPYKRNFKTSIISCYYTFFYRRGKILVNRLKYTLCLMSSQSTCQFSHLNSNTDLTILPTATK